MRRHVDVIMNCLHAVFIILPFNNLTVTENVVNKYKYISLIEPLHNDITKFVRRSEHIYTMLSFRNVFPLNTRND
jgi:hypothetical protein